MLHKMWSQNFNCGPATMDHHTPEVFTRCYWQKAERVTVVWLLYKIILAVYFFVTWYLSFISFGREVVQNKYFIYFTNWSYCLLTLSCLISAILTTHRFIVERRKGVPDSTMTVLPIAYKVYWLLYTVCVPSAVAVDVIFWAAIFNPELHPVDFINLTTHLINSVIAVGDFLLVAHPYRILHFHWVAIYAIIYGVFSLIYYFAGGTDVRDEPFIYKILDWRSPGKATITCVGVLIVMLVIHLVMWGIHHLKKHSRTKCLSIKMDKYSEGEVNFGMEHKMAPIATIIV